MNVHTALRMAAAAGGALYSKWTQLRYSMFGAGLPQQDPFGEFVSLSEDSNGWDYTGNYAGVLRDGTTESVAWYGTITNVWADAPTDHTLVLLADITYTTTGTTAGLVGLVGSGNIATASAAVAGGVGYKSGTESYTQTQRSTLAFTVVAAASTRRVRVLTVPMPGSTYTRAGVVVALPRTSADGIPAGAAVNFIQQNAAADVAAADQASVLFGTATALAGAATILDAAFWAKGAVVPLPPWDGGVGWEEVLFPGGAPDADPKAQYVSSGAAGTPWEVTLDSGIAAGDGVQNDVLYLPGTPAVLSGKMDGKTPFLVAISFDYTSGTPTGVVVEAGVRWNTTAAALGVGMWFNTATNLVAAGDLLTLISTASGSTTYNYGTVGGILGNVGEAGTPTGPVGYSLGYSVTSPNQGATTPAQLIAGGTVSTDFEFFVGLRFRTASGGNKAIKFRVWVYALDINVAEPL